MTDINKLIEDEYQRIASTPTGTTLSELGPQRGVSDILSRKYVVGERASEMFIDDPVEWGNVVGEDLPIIYGRTLIRPEVMDGGYARDDIDPSLVLREFQFITGEGPNFGIEGSDSGDEKKNILINCTPVENPDGSVNYGKMILKQVVGLGAGELIKGVASSIFTTDEDPVTGKKLVEAITGKPKMKEFLGQLADVDAGGAQKLDIMTYSPNDECGWKAAPFVEVFEKSGIKIEPLIVQENGVVKAADTVVWNFVGATVSYDEAERKATITITGDASGEGGDTGGGSGGGDTGGAACGQIFICFDPTPGQTYQLKLAGAQVASATAEEGETRASLAIKLVDHVNALGPYEHYSISGPPKNSDGTPKDESFAFVKVGPGYDPCLGCPGALTITDYNNNVLCTQDAAESECAPRLPSV